MNFVKREQDRLAVQAHLDRERSQIERNRLGQFATPPELAREIVQFGVDFLSDSQQIRFFDPAFGTGAFFSALKNYIPEERIASAQGFEIDRRYGMAARRLWLRACLDLRLEDFTRAHPPLEESERFNFIICNPPYVRHHHIDSAEKKRLQKWALHEHGISVSGLAGLYCYFLMLSHLWMQRDAIAGWLIPGEFMDVNYGDALKNYLLNR